ncbi:MAG TPA: protoporphyrinogen oxidase [Methylomirabilota bacterium]|jgi:oxygen-dependent protoporphyrinogen oxidase|nr:protoporphyrinogen oxidase [Methylomirabilota bacterium]
MATARIPHFVIVGGGIAGLAAAHRLVELGREREQPLRLTLLEASNRVGGAIDTERREDFLLELGPDSFVSEKPWALALCERIGLESELIGTRDEHRTTFVVRAGKLEPLPEGFMLLAPTKVGPLLRSRIFSWPGKLRMALDLVLPRGNQEDESLGSFVRRRFGREVLERVAQPLIGGIYTADPERLSLAATMPRFLQMERAHRSVIYAMWQAARKRPQEAKGASGARWSLFVTLRKGLQQFVDTLVSRLTLGEVRRNTVVSSIQRSEGEWIIDCEDGALLRADGVVLATPAFQTARIVQALDPQLSRSLASISYSSAATINLAYRREHVPHPLNGFGFVVPHIEHRAIIAGSFSSVKYAGRAPESSVLLRAFVGGALQETLFTLDDQAMEQAVRQELASLLGIQAAPLFVRIARYPHSLPQYLVGHLKLVEHIEQQMAQYASLALAGNAYRGVGIADCVRSGEAAAGAILKSIE